MSRPSYICWIATGLASLLAAGCAPTQPFYFFEKGELSHYVGMATKIESPDVTECSLAESTDPLPPLSLANMHYDSVWDLPLQEAVHIALQNSKVMRTLGARFATTGSTRPQVGDASTVLLSSPAAVPTTYDPAIVEANPNLGVEGALSAYDAVFSSSFTWDHQDHPQDALPNANFVLNRVFQQDQDTLTTGITKRAAPGTTLSIVDTITYTDSNSPLLESTHDNQHTVDFSLVQRLLRGGGTLFNEIHGPLDANQTGIGSGFSGVMISRINMDISLANFEIGVRNLVDDTENAYWELYFAYRALDAAKVGRDSALETWKKINVLREQNAKGGEANNEAEARNQYYTFRAEVEQALTDLYRTENRLRYLMGLAATDGRLIRPKDEPTTAKVVFDWHEVHQEGLVRSAELRMEKWKIKQLELELIASKNLLLPNLDLEARYRLFGLGEYLDKNDGTSYRGTPTETIDGTDATATMANADFREWNVGLVFSMPLGFRKELTTIRDQQLLLSREKAVLQDQELELSHQLTDVVRNLDTQYQLMQTNFNRRLASEEEVEAEKVAFEAGTVTLDLLLQAQQRRADAEAAYYRSLIDYNRGIAGVHYAKGSLLEYDEVYLAEGPWPGKAYFDAHRLARSRDAALYMNYGSSRPSVFSRGPVEQHADAGQVQGQPTNAMPQEEIGKPQQLPQQTAPQDGLQPDNSQPGNANPAKTPSSVRKPRPVNSTGPQLGSATGPAPADSDRASMAMDFSSASPLPSGNGSASASPPQRWRGSGDDNSGPALMPVGANQQAAGWKSSGN